MVKKDKRMTLKEAAEFLKTTQYSYSLAALKAAAKNGRMNAEKVEGPSPFYLVSQADLLKWCADPEMHKTGPKKE